MRERVGWPYRGEGIVRVETVRRRDQALYRRCESLEYRVFLESGYVENSPGGRVSAFDRYPHHDFLAAFAVNGGPFRAVPEPLGVMRIIYAPHDSRMKPGLFPTLDHAEELRIEPEKLARIMAMDPRTFIDIATMAIPDEQRNARVSKALITQIMKHVWGTPPLRYALAAIDTVFYGKLKTRDLPLEDLGPSALYLGSPSTATLGDSRQVLKGARRVVPAWYRLTGWMRR